MNKFIKLFLTGLMLMTIANCGGGGTSISTSSTSDSFDEDDLGFNPKMDILFVVDPSKSMFEEVEKVRNNIAVFIESFIELGYEYRVGVISSSAWSALAYEADTNLTFLAPSGDPVFGNLHKGECVDRAGAGAQDAYLDSLNTAGVGPFLSKFSKNFDVYGTQLNTSGCGLVGPPFANPAYSEVLNNFFEDSNGYDEVTRQQVWEYINDERPLQSVRAFLERDATKVGPAKFVREGAHLAIIIVSDEPDASRDSLTPSLTFIPGAAGNHTAQQYIDFLTAYKDDPSTTTINEGLANFSIYSIVDTSFDGVNIAEDVAAMSGGLAFDINASTSEYVDNLGQISQAILVSSSFFPIAYRPIPSTIEIQIFKESGEVVTVPTGGFVYLPTQQGVTLTAQYLPGVGDSLKINYVPAQLISGVSEQPRLTINDTAIPERPVSAGASLNPGDPGYDADTNTKNGSILGTVSLVFGDATGGTYSIASSDPVGAYSIDAVTGIVSVADASLFDSEDQGKHQLEIDLTMPDASVFNRSFLISIQDIPDVTPISDNDSYTVSETLAENNNIRILGNVTYNDTNIDAAEAHTWEVVTNVAATSGSPAPSSSSVGSPNLVLNPNGSFELNITDADALALDSGDDVTYTFTYRIVGTPGTEISNTSTVSVTIEGFNQAPFLSLAIPDQTVEFSGGEVDVPFVLGDITSSGVGSGSLANLIDGNTGTNLETSSSGAHFIRLDFPGTSLYEVDRFVITGASGHSLGNSIFQVLTSTGDAVTREVLPVTTAAGSSITVTMNQKIIGGGVRIIRPVGAKNSAGHDNLQVSEVVVRGVLAQDFTIDLNNHFTDPDGDTLTYFVTDEYGEGPAPGWISVVGNNLTGIPPAGANTNVGVIAQDPSGSTAFTVFNITRIGAGGGAANGAPIAVLPIDDTKRGGISMKRFGCDNDNGSGCENANPNLDTAIRHGEIDNFFVDPYAGQAIRDALTTSGLCSGGTGTCSLDASGYRTNPASIPDQIEALLPSTQLAHFGDAYGRENGWSIVPTYEDDKFPASSTAYCNQSSFLTPGNGGRITPCINLKRSYGETYSGYFVPAQTGIYRFRTRRIDDNIRLFLAPTEYLEDLTPVVTVSYCVGSMVTMTQSIAPGLNTGSTCSSEFRGTPGGPTGGDYGAAVGAPTSIFYEGTTESYKNGYVLLKQGNVYALELRFAEGGGAVAFEFEYDRKDQSCDPTTNSPTSGCWDGFRPIDASVLVPAEGSDAHDPQVIDAPSNVVSLDVKTLFYDAEQDILDYTARLINPDGSVYLTGDISEIGLTLNAQNGLLSGTLNAGYLAANPRPRIVFTATERFTAAQAATSSLPIKFNPN